MSWQKNNLFFSTPPDIVVDNCAICRNHIMDLCMFILTFPCALLNSSLCAHTHTHTQASSVKPTRHRPLVKSAQWHGVCATMLSTSIVSHVGSRPDKSVPLTTGSGNFTSKPQSTNLLDLSLSLSLSLSVGMAADQ